MSLKKASGWNIPFFTNINLVIVVGISFDLQIFCQHDLILGSFLKTLAMPFANRFLLLAVGACKVSPP